MKKIILSAAIAALSFGTIYAQDSDDNEPTTSNKDTSIRFWEARLPGGNYLVSLSNITSISKHRYLVGGIEVIEVVVDTKGNSLARFYTFDMVGSKSEANALKNLTDRTKGILQDGAKRAGVNGTPVSKEYPRTTHAKTVEYALVDEKTLDALFNSAKRSWTRNKGSRFTVK